MAAENTTPTLRERMLGWLGAERKIFGMSQFDNLWIERIDDMVGPSPEERDRPDFVVWVWRADG